MREKVLISRITLPLDLQKYKILTFNDVNDDEKGGLGGVNIFEDG